MIPQPKLIELSARDVAAIDTYVMQPGNALVAIHGNDEVVRFHYIACKMMERARAYLALNDIGDWNPDLGAGIQPTFTGGFYCLVKWRQSRRRNVEAA